jgi:hypothetical protein
VRVTAGSLLLLSIVLLCADAYTAARMTDDCCCAGMSKNACPLKQPGRRVCDPHRRNCSLEQADAAAGTRYSRWRDTRDPSALTENPFRVWAPPAALSFPSPARSHADARNRAPEMPPPRNS